MGTLFHMVFSLLAVTLAGVAVVIALVAGVTGWIWLCGSAVAGAVVAAPISWAIAKGLAGR